MSKPKWDKVDKKTWARGAYRIERRARDQFLALGPPGEGDDEKIPGHLGCWGKVALAKAACDEHEAGLGKGAKATAMVWTRDDETQTWTSPGPNDQTYVLEQDNGERWYIAIDGEELCPPEGLESRELAEALCQRHRDTELVWREAEPGTIWVAASAILEREDYCVSLGTGLEPTWQAQHLSEAIGEPSKHLMWAQEACQEHHRELVGPPDGERDVKPERELGDWMIGRPPTTEIRAELSLKQAKTSEEIQALEIELAAKERAFKAERKRIEKEIAEIRERQIALAAEVRHGMTAKIRCWRERDGDDWHYTDESGAELFREPAADGEQQKLCGDRTVSKGDQLLEELEAAIKRAFEEKTPEAITAAGDAIDAAAAHLQGEQLKELRARHAEVAATAAPWEDEQAPAAKPSSTELPRELPVRPLTREDFTRQSSGDYLTNRHHAPVDGEHYRIGKAEGSKLYRVTFADTEQRKRELPGEHRLLKDAVEQASRDNLTRLRWPGDPESGLLVSKCGKYQLARWRKESGQWHAEAVGGQDEDNTDLGEHDDLPAAQAACQHHADTGRADDG